MIKRIILYIIIPIFIGLNSSAQEVQDSTKRVYTLMRLDSLSNTDAADSLVLKAEVAYHLKANDTLACKYIEQAMKRYEDSGNTKGTEYAKLTLLWCQYGSDVFIGDAIVKGEAALNTFKRLGKTQEYAECLSSLAYCYSIKEDSLNLNSKKSIEYCLEAIGSIDPLFHGESYVSTLSHLSLANSVAGNFHQSIEIAEKCIVYIDSCLKNLVPHTVTYAKYADAYALALNAKTMSLYYQGNYVESLRCNKMHLQFSLANWGKTSRYANCAYNLGMTEKELGLYLDAYNHFVEALNSKREIGRLPLEEEIELRCHMLDLCIRLGWLYESRPKYGYLSSLVNELDVEKYPYQYGIYLNTAVKYWLYVGDLSNAYYMLHKSFDNNVGHYIDDDVFIQMNIAVGNDSIAYKYACKWQEDYNSRHGIDDIVSLNNLPNVIKSAMAIDDWIVADSCSNRYLYGMREHIGKTFPIITSEDRKLLLDKVQDPLFKYIPSFFNFTRCFGFEQAMYDLALLHKGLLLRTEQELSNLVKQYKNNEASELYYEISDNVARLKKEWDQNPRDSISNLVYQGMETLQKLIPAFSEITNQYDISWRDIKNSLHNSEFAIEFIDVIDYITGIKSCKAIVLKNNWDSPQYIDLFNENDLSNVDIEDYYTTSHLFTLIWEPIYARIFQHEDTVGKVFFSPSDMISQIAVESIVDYWGEVISDSIEFYRLSSTKELVSRNKKIQINNVVAYGGLEYDASIDDLVRVNEQFDAKNIVANRFSPDFVNNKRTGIYYLPSTKIEVELIAAELQQKGINSCLREGLSGTEESFIALDQSATNILHIATHGFYWSQTELDSLQTKRAISMSQLGLNMYLSNEDNAMTRSGLFLSGVNIALRGQELCENICDGILTAQEISKLNFHELDLAVLSACDTGLGEIESGEGVMGLQRGFKKAGANSILMSLWKVDDNATQQLMVEFYRNFLNGKTKMRSLWNAQKCIRETPGFEDPEYWAGFILLDALN